MTDARGGSRRDATEVWRRAQARCAAALAVGLSGGVAEGGAPETRAFVLGGRALSIDAPADAELDVSERAALITLDGATRTPRVIEIALDPADAGAPAPPASLSVYTDYRYETSVAPGGSGGDEVRLDGVWAVGGRRYAVRCRTQVEGATEDDAAWCLPMLRTFGEAIEPIDDGTGATDP